MDRVSSSQPGEFISCFKRYRRGSFPAPQSAAFLASHTLTRETKPSFSIHHFLSLSLLLSFTLGASFTRSLAHSLAHSCGCNVTTQPVNIPWPAAEAFQIVLFVRNVPQRRGGGEAADKITNQRTRAEWRTCVPLGRSDTGGRVCVQPRLRALSCCRCSRRPLQRNLCASSLNW